MNKKDIGIKIQPIFEKDGVRVRMLKVWLFWEDKPYPLNFIGMGFESIARNLDISELQAIGLLILKLRPEKRVVEGYMGEWLIMVVSSFLTIGLLLIPYLPYLHKAIGGIL